MKHLKLKIIAVLALLPLPSAMAHAVAYSENIDQTSVHEYDYNSEFFRRLELGLLREPYYNYLEEKGVYSSEELMMQQNSATLNTLQRNFKKEYGDIQLASDGAGSIQPD